MKKLNQLEDHLGYWIRFVSNCVSNSFKQKLEAYEIGVADWIVLRKLYDQSILSPSTLADLIGVTRGAMTKLLDRLLKKSLVERVESITDRRYQDIKLTEQGKNLVPKLVAIADENDQQFFACLSEKEQQKIIEMFKKIVKFSSLHQIPIN